MQRKIWGTDVYTDDSDPIVAAIHSGWIRGAWSAEVDVSILELDNIDPQDETNPQEQEIKATPNGTKGVDLNGGQSAQSESKKESANGLHDLADLHTLTLPPPGGPITPPANRDAHITLLMLPPLEKYAASNFYGVRSRKWGVNHDGMSFKIEKIEFVDEGETRRNEEKGLKARRARMNKGFAISKRSGTMDPGPGEEERREEAVAVGMTKILG